MPRTDPGPGEHYDEDGWCNGDQVFVVYRYSEPGGALQHWTVTQDPMTIVGAHKEKLVVSVPEHQAFLGARVVDADDCYFSQELAGEEADRRENKRTQGSV